MSAVPFTPDPFDLVVPEAPPDARPLDEAEVRQGVDLLFLDGLRELSGLRRTTTGLVPCGRFEVRGDDVAGVIEAARQLARAGATGVYWSLNPLRGPLGRFARVPDFLRRDWLLLDFDPVKPSADLNASDEERRKVEAVATAVVEDLASKGWPRPVVVDTGGGWHAYYRIALENDHASRAIVKSVLQRVKREHSAAGVIVDDGTASATTHGKLPGTWSLKGPDRVDRPARLARVVMCPVELEVPTVPTDLLLDYAKSSAPTISLPLSTADPLEVKAPAAPTGDLAAYFSKAIDDEVAEVASTRRERHKALAKSAYKLGGLIPQGLDREEATRRLTLAGLAIQLPENEVASTIRDQLEAGAANPRGGPAPKPERTSTRTSTSTPTPPADLTLTVKASDVVPRVVRWYWPGRVPVGFITVLAGRTGVGKSYVTCDFVARMTSGAGLPDSPGDGVKRRALFISEDPADFVLVPRLTALGANLERVRILTWEAAGFYTLQDTDFLTRAWEESGRPEIVVIDPPTNHLGDKDEHRNSEVREVLTALVRWLEGKDVAIILITHVNKQTGAGVDAVNRVMGSVAWMTTARIGHSFAPDPKVPGRMLFSPLKSNLGPLGQSLAYKITPAEELAVVEWCGLVDTTADEAMSSDGKRAKVADLAAKWFVDRFIEKRVWFAKDLEDRAREDGVKRNAYFDGSKSLTGIVKERVASPGGRTVWQWSVPPDWSHFPAGVRGVDVDASFDPDAF